LKAGPRQVQRQEPAIGEVVPASTHHACPPRLRKGMPTAPARGRESLTKRVDVERSDTLLGAPAYVLLE